MADVFISYARADWDHAKQLADQLTTRGYQVWWDVELVGSDNFRDVIMAELEAAKAVIVIWSASSCCSNFVLDEAGRALRAGKLVSTRLDSFDLQNLPLGFGTQHTDLVTQLERISPALDKLGIDTTAKKSAAEQARLLSETAFWNEISASEELQDFKLYISEYPDGLHRAHARLRIRKLKTDKPGQPEHTVTLNSNNDKQKRPERSEDHSRHSPSPKKRSLPIPSPVFGILAFVFAIIAIPAAIRMSILFHDQRWSFLGSDRDADDASGAVIATVLIIIAAMLIMRARGAALGKVERAIYWLTTALISGVTLLMVFESFSQFNFFF